MTAELVRLRWPEVRGERVLALPLGSCEQHGPHLPLGTDSTIAATLAGSLAAQRAEILVGPPLGIGASWEHAGFPGLISITGDLLAALLVEVARSADWAKGLVIVSGHGGNIAGVNAAVRTIRGEGRRVMAWAPRGDGDAHAGHTETSVMLALDPAAVAFDRAEAGWVGPLDEVRSRGVAAIAPNGVLGDPSAATAEHGREVLARWSTDLLTVYDRWRAGPDDARRSS